jgi:hypothetical protein
MHHVRRPQDAGQDPHAQPLLDLSDPLAYTRWTGRAREIIEDLRNLALDAAAPRGKRRLSRHHLRGALCVRFRALDALVKAIDVAHAAPPAS